MLARIANLISGEQIEQKQPDLVIVLHSKEEDRRQSDLASEINDKIFYGLDPLQGYTYVTKENFWKHFNGGVHEECVFTTEVTDNQLALYWGHQITRMSFWFRSKLATYTTLQDIQHALEFLKSQKPYREELPGDKHYDYYSIVNIVDEWYGQAVLMATDASVEEHHELASKQKPQPTRIHLYDPKMNLYVYESISEYNRLDLIQFNRFNTIN